MVEKEETTSQETSISFINKSYKLVLLVWRHSAGQIYDNLPKRYQATINWSMLILLFAPKIFFFVSFLVIVFSFGYFYAETELRERDVYERIKTIRIMKEFQEKPIIDKKIDIFKSFEVDDSVIPTDIKQNMDELIDLVVRDFISFWYDPM